METSNDLTAEEFADLLQRLVQFPGDILFMDGFEDGTEVCLDTSWVTLTPRQGAFMLGLKARMA